METWAEWKSFAEINWLPKLGQGSARVVYALDDKRALKLVRWSDDDFGLRQAQNEALFWETHKRTPIAEHIAEIFAYGVGWSIMERADHHLSGDDWRLESEIIYKLVVGTNRLISDVYARNIGVFGDTYKLIDYGLS